MEGGGQGEAAGAVRAKIKRYVEAFVDYNKLRLQRERYPELKAVGKHVQDTQDAKVVWLTLMGKMTGKELAEASMALKVMMADNGEGG